MTNHFISQDGGRIRSAYLSGHKILTETAKTSWRTDNFLPVLLLYSCRCSTDVENGCSLELLYFIASAQLLLPSALLLCNSPISFIVRRSSIQKYSYAFFLSLFPKLKIVISSSYIHFLVRQVLNVQRPVSKAWKNINGLVNRQWQAKQLQVTEIIPSCARTSFSVCGCINSTELH